jgi:hypothetical protein
LLDQLRLVIEDIRNGENIDLYVIIVVGAVVAVLGILKAIDFEIVGAAILGTLSLLAGSLLTSRRSIEELGDAADLVGQEVQALHKELESRASVSDLFSPEGYPNLSAEFRAAKSISILGQNLTSTVSRYHPDFRYILSRGRSLRYLMTETTPEAVAMMAFRSNSMPTPADIKTAVARSVTLIKRLFDYCSDPGCLQLRTMPYIAPYSMVIIERDSEDFDIYVRTLPYKDSRYPTFSLSSETDRYWAEFFTEQFESMWQVATDTLQQK